MWDVSPLNKWDVRGRDALAAAQRLHSGNVLGLDEGQVRYGAFCDPDGLMTDDGTVFKLADDHVWVMTNSDAHAEEFAAAIEGMDAGIEYVIRQMPHLQIQGPKSRETLEPRHRRRPVGPAVLPVHPRAGEGLGNPRVAVAHRLLGRAGLRAVRRPRERRRPVAGHGGLGCVPFGTAAVEILRIEAGMVVTDYDYEPTRSRRTTSRSTGWWRSTAIPSAGRP